MSSRRAAHADVSVCDQFCPALLSEPEYQSRGSAEVILLAAQNFRLEIVRLNTKRKALGKSYIRAPTHQESEIGAGDAGRWRGDVNNQVLPDMSAAKQRMSKNSYLILTNTQLRAGGKRMHVVKNAGEIAGAEHTIRRLEGSAFGGRTIIPTEIRHHANPPVGIDRSRKIPSVQDSTPSAGSGIGREGEPGAHERVAGKYLGSGCLLRLCSQS